MNLCTSPKPVRTFAIEPMESRRLLSISIGALGAVAHPNLQAAAPAKACEESHETSGIRRLEHFHPHGEVEFAMSFGSPHAREVGGGVEVQVQISVNGSLPPPAPVPVTRLDSAGPEAAAPIRASAPKNATPNAPAISGATATAAALAVAPAAAALNVAPRAASAAQAIGAAASVHVASAEIASTILQSSYLAVERIVSSSADDLTAAVRLDRAIALPGLLLPQSAQAVADALPAVNIPVAGSVAEALAAATASPVRAFHIAHLGSPFTFLADSIAAFAEDSASISSIVPVADAGASRPHKAWFVTGAVLAADAVLLSALYRKSDKNRRRVRALG